MRISLLTLALLSSLMFIQLIHGQDKKLEKFFLSNSTLSESRAPLYIAQDLKLFEKYGLDAQIVNIRGSAINNASLMAGEIQMAVANGTIAITAAARGAPIVIVGTIGPTRYSLVSRSLTSVSQLKVKPSASAASASATTSCCVACYPNWDFPRRTLRYCPPAPLHPSTG